MAKANLATMDVQSLLNLRKQVDAALAQRRTELEKQLRDLGGGVRGAQGVSKLRGRKVEPKYRGPQGETWAGRGAKPRWLVAAMKDTGKKLTDFLIDKPLGAVRKKRRAKK
jgi:DNA-binding protein H-NS